MSDPKSVYQYLAEDAKFREIKTKVTQEEQAKFIKESSQTKTSPRNKEIARRMFEDSVEEIVKRFERESNEVTSDDRVISMDGLRGILEAIGVFVCKSVLKVLKRDARFKKRIKQRLGEEETFFEQMWLALFAFYLVRKQGDLMTKNKLECKQQVIEVVSASMVKDTLLVFLDTSLSEKDKARKLLAIHQDACATLQNKILYKAHTRMLEKAGEADQIVREDITELISADKIRSEVISKFLLLYSDKYKNPQRLFSIAFPQRQEQLQKDTSFPFQPQINDNSRNLYDLQNLSKLLQDPNLSISLLRDDKSCASSRLAATGCKHDVLDAHLTMEQILSLPDQNYTMSQSEKFQADQFEHSNAKEAEQVNAQKADSFNNTSLKSEAYKQQVVEPPKEEQNAGLQIQLKKMEPDEGSRSRQSLLPKTSSENLGTYLVPQHEHDEKSSNSSPRMECSPSDDNLGDGPALQPQITQRTQREEPLENRASLPDKRNQIFTVESDPPTEGKCAPNRVSYNSESSNRNPPGVSKFSRNEIGCMFGKFNTVFGVQAKNLSRLQIMELKEDLKRMRLNQKRSEVEQKQMAECTFQPKTSNDSYKQKHNVYQSSALGHRKKNKTDYIPFKDRDDNPSGLTFSPRTNKDYISQKVLQHSPKVKWNKTQKLREQMKAEREKAKSNETKVQQIRQVYKSSILQQRRPKMRNRKAESRY